MQRQLQNRLQPDEFIPAELLNLVVLRGFVEYTFRDHKDPELARAVSAGRKKEFAAFGWDSDLIPDAEDPATFASSKLRWEEVGAGDHTEMLGWYQALIRFRRTTPCLNGGTAGKVRVTLDEQAKWLRMERGTIVVTCNLGNWELAFDESEQSRVVLASQSAFASGQGKLVLPSDSVAVVSECHSRNA
jgi:maltooligosyltrehalose trehalohydrolase